MSGLNNVLGNVYGNADDEPQKPDLGDVKESMDALLEHADRQAAVPHETDADGGPDASALEPVESKDDTEATDVMDDSADDVTSALEELTEWVDGQESSLADPTAPDNEFVAEDIDFEFDDVPVAPPEDLGPSPAEQTAPEMTDTTLDVGATTNEAGDSSWLAETDLFESNDAVDEADEPDWFSDFDEVDDGPGTAAASANEASDPAADQDRGLEIETTDATADSTTGLEDFGLELDAVDSSPAEATSVETASATDTDSNASALDENEEAWLDELFTLDTDAGGGETDQVHDFFEDMPAPAASPEPIAFTEVGPADSPETADAARSLGSGLAQSASPLPDPTTLTQATDASPAVASALAEPATFGGWARVDDDILPTKGASGRSRRKKKDDVVIEIDTAQMALASEPVDEAADLTVENMGEPATTFAEFGDSVEPAGSPDSFGEAETAISAVSNDTLEGVDPPAAGASEVALGSGPTPAEIETLPEDDPIDLFSPEEDEPKRGRGRSKRVPKAKKAPREKKSPRGKKPRSEKPPREKKPRGEKKPPREPKPPKAKRGRRNSKLSDAEIEAALLAEVDAAIAATTDDTDLGPSFEVSDTLATPSADLPAGVADPLEAALMTPPPSVDDSLD